MTKRTEKTKLKKCFSRSAPFLPLLLLLIALKVVSLSLNFRFVESSPRDVPQTLTLSAEVFRASTPVPLVRASERLFGGVHAVLDATPWGNTLLMILVGFTFLLLVIGYRTQNPLLLRCALGCGFLGSVALSFRFSQGFDEFYVNLRHSYSLAHYGIYSLNFFSPNEATVDFLPFFFVGLLGRTGFPLEETAIVLSLAGNVLVMTAFFAWIHRFTRSHAYATACSIMVGFLPPLSAIGGSGFMAAVFSGTILWSLYLLFFSERRRSLGLLLLSILPLIRTEGVFLLFLVWCLEHRLLLLDAIQRRAPTQKIQSMVVEGFFLTVPFILLSLFRIRYFGHFLPTPMVHKSTANLGYVWMGFRQFFQLVGWFCLREQILTTMALFVFLKKAESEKNENQMFYVQTCLLLFVLPYFVGGGDWFPGAWNRYMMSFQLLSNMWFLILLHRALQAHGRKWNATTQIAVPAMVLVVVFHTPLSYLVEGIPANPQRWKRVNQLSQFGDLIRQTTPQTTLIGTSEVATINYFSQRDLVDLFGLASDRIARSQLTPFRAGDILQRRRDPCTIERERPQIIALGEVFELIPSEWQRSDLNSLVKWFASVTIKDPIYFNSGYFRLGAIDRLANLGYHFLVFFNGDVVFRYFVHESIYELHKRALEGMGIRSALQTDIPFTVNEAVAHQWGRDICSN